MEDDQKTLLAEPITRQRLDVLEEIEKPDWAKDHVSNADTDEGKGDGGFS